MTVRSWFGILLTVALIGGCDSDPEVIEDAGTATEDSGTTPEDAGTTPDEDAGEADAGATTVACPDGFSNFCCARSSATNCVEIAGGDTTALLTATNLLEDNTTLVLGDGMFDLTSAVVLGSNDAPRNGVTLIGQGIDATNLSFAGATTQFNGVDVRGNNFLVQDLTVTDAPKDGIRVENSTDVTFRRIRTTWTAPLNLGTTNGAYGIYPVRCTNVLVEDSRAEGASDAGLYVGQCVNAIVRNNVCVGNVAGLEIENTQYADVYNNTVEDNAAGLLIFDLPGNPVIGRDVRVHDNVVRNNNLQNFAPGGTVAEIPAGIGTFAMASRRVEIVNNTYENNNTTDIALISGLVIIGRESRWELNTADLVGEWEDLNLLVPNDDMGMPQSGVVTNYRSENIVVSGNSHSGSGTNPGSGFSDPNGFRLVFLIIYGRDAADPVVYDTIGETSWHPTDASMNTNDNHICVGGNTGGTFASLYLEDKQSNPSGGIFQPAAPFTPFECTTLNGSALVLPSFEGVTDPTAG